MPQGKSAVKKVRRFRAVPQVTPEKDSAGRARPIRKAVSNRSKRQHQIAEELEPVQNAPERYSSASFARRVKERTEELGLSQRQVAQRADIDPSFLTRITSGERNAPSDDVIERLARALEMPTLDLFLEAGRIPKLNEGVKRALPAFIDAAGELSEGQIRAVLSTLEFIRKKGRMKQ
jgi:transcriptional regulator with XRE-family HTH domain